LSGIAGQLADDGHSRRGNLGGSLVHSMLLMYSPDGTNVYVSRDGEVKHVIGSMQGVESSKIVFIGVLPIHLFKHF